MVLQTLSLGNLTCHKYNGSSTVDYFVSGEGLLDSVIYMQVRDWLPYSSDHCPISICLNTCIDIKRGLHVPNKQEKEGAPKKIKWDAMKDYIFRRKLQSPGVNDKVQHILSTTIENDPDVENVISDLNSMLINAACVNVPKRCRRKKTRQIWGIWKLRPAYSPETPNLGQNRYVSSRVTLKFDGWPWKTIGHLFFAVSSFVQHSIAIGEFKLELQSGNAQFESNSTIFRAIWPWNLTDDLEKQ